MNTFSLVTIISILFSALSGESPHKNTVIITAAEEPESEPDLGVSKCYTCQEDCIGPLQEQNCTDLHELVGHVVKSACLTYELTLDDGTIEISRGCIHDEATVSATCIATNILSTRKCSICRDELCNQRDEDKGVKECYFCDGTCADPMEKQNCFEVLGAVEAECQNAIKADGEIIRRCVKTNDFFVGIACRGINLGGGNCTMCNSDLCNDYGQVATTTDLPTTTTSIENSSTSTTDPFSSAGTTEENTEKSTSSSGSTEGTTEKNDDDGSEGFHKVTIVLIFALLFSLNC